MNGQARAQDTRRNILEAADRALRSKGLLGASTREIAREAGVADGTLYVHFHDRIDLFIELIQGYLPSFVEPLQRLHANVGQRTVQANLTEVLQGTMTWHQKLLPVFSALSADPALGQALRERFAERAEGPHLAVKAVERYLTAEQKLGRVNRGSSPKAVAVMLFGASHYWNAVKQGVGHDLGYTPRRLIKETVDSLYAGMRPDAEETKAPPRKSRKTVAKSRA